MASIATEEFEKIVLFLGTCELERGQWAPGAPWGVTGFPYHNPELVEGFGRKDRWEELEEKVAGEGKFA